MNASIPPSMNCRLRSALEPSFAPVSSVRGRRPTFPRASRIARKVALAKSRSEHIGDHPSQKRRYRGQNHYWMASTGNLAPDIIPKIAQGPSANVNCPARSGAQATLTAAEPEDRVRLRARVEGLFQPIDVQHVNSPVPEGRQQRSEAQCPSAGSLPEKTTHVKSLS